MKTLLILTIVITACAGGVRAQTENNDKWSSVSPGGEEFSITAPASFDGTAVSDKNASRRYYAVSNGAYYFIFSDDPKDSWQTKTVLSFVAENKATPVKRTIGGLTAEEYFFTGSDAYSHRVMVVQTARRTYVFQTASPLRDDPGPDRFIESIRFDKSAVGKVGGAAGLRTVLSATGLTGKGTGNGTSMGAGSSGSGTGMGSGSGGGSGGGMGTGVGDSGSNTKSLKLLTKPAAGYNDLARFYGITGTVRVRVTFQSDGKVGPVSPVNSLPFGLTGAAVEAAKGIKFEPAVREGVPYSVTKTVEYSFSIY
jgi:TonB family protein